jgi:hypothetical protein
VSSLSRHTSQSNRPGTLTSPLTVVYDGLHCLGHVLACGRQGFRAFDADDRPLGTFPTLRDAIGAITGAAP